MSSIDPNDTSSHPSASNPAADSVINFLRPMFPDPRNIVRSIAANSALLSGHRVLSLFCNKTPVSADDPLIFYVPDSEECISALLMALEDEGVVFDDIYKPFRELLAASPSEPTTLSVMFHDMNCCYMGGNNSRIRQEGGIPDSIKGGDAITNLFMQAAKIMNKRMWLEYNKAVDTDKPIVIDVGNSKLVVHFDRPDPQTTTLHPLIVENDENCVVHGRTSHNGSSFNIQVISRFDWVPIEHILSLEYTHLQCFISAYGAAHLYHKVTSKYMTYVFGDDTTHVQAPA